MNAVITGASTGIGRAIAIQMARKYDNTFLLARSAEGLAHTADLVNGAGGHAIPLEIDLRDPNSIRTAASEIAKVGSVGLLGNVAAEWHNDTQAYHDTPLSETPFDQVKSVMDVGATAPLLLTHCLLPAFSADREAHILNVSGTFGSGGAGWLHYFVSKQAIEAFTVALADELADTKIRVNCISPADVATEPYIRFFPDDAQTALTPEDVATFAETLMSEACPYVSGEIIILRQRPH